MALFEYLELFEYCQKLLILDYGCHPSRISRDVPDLRQAVPRPGKTSPGMLNVADFKVHSK